MGGIFLRIIFSVVLTFIIISIYNYLPFLWSSNSKEIWNDNLKSNIQVTETITTATPTDILIPTIGLNTKVIPVGKTATGNMDVPKKLSQTGWYMYGVHPGEIGNAVIDGHEVDSFGFGTVFKDLHKLKIGDEIKIKNEDEKILTFKVTKLETYPYKDAPIQEIFGTSTTRNLNLITCSGDFITNLKTKTRRLVVYSTQVN